MAELQDLGPGRVPMIRTHYPHMLKEDNAVWSKFLDRNFERLQEVWYDVRVGQAVNMDDSATEMEKRIARGLTRKRIDVVGWDGGSYWVIEVKPYASMGAIGQVISYARMFADEYVIKGRVVPVIVCDETDQDLLKEYEELGILVIANEQKTK